MDNNFNYDEQLDTDYRKDNGIYYTPNKVIDIIYDELDIKDGDSVLEPSSGVGRFVFPILDKNVAVDSVEIDGESLSIQSDYYDKNEFTGSLSTYNLDYFEFEPNKEYDYIIGNPPYISSSKIKNRSSKREYIPDGVKLSKRADIYAYFIIKALQELKLGGKLAFVVPISWRETQYGKQLKNHIINNYKLDSIYMFNGGIFEKDVKTEIIIIENSKPDSNSITVYNYINYDKFETEKISQNDLINNPDLLKFLGYPSSIKDISLHENMVKFGDSTGLEYFSGVKTGAINFFKGVETGAINFFKGVETGAINDKFISEVYMQDMNDKFRTSKIRDSDTTYLLTLSEYVNSNNIDSINELKSKLKQDRYNYILNYIINGEEEEYDNGKTVSNRDIWCVLENTVKPDIIHLSVINDDFNTVLNDDDYIIDNCKFGINTDSEEVYFPLLNSYIYKIFINIYSLNHLNDSVKLQLNTVKSIPIPKLSKLSEEQISKLEDSYNNLLYGEYKGLADEVILELTNSDLDVDDLEQIYQDIVQSRI